jgi:hypothetical protein
MPTQHLSVKSWQQDAGTTLLALTVSQAVYTKISDIPFVIPMNPGPNLDIPPVNATGQQITSNTKAHKEDLRIWREYMATDKVLKRQQLYWRFKKCSTCWTNIVSTLLLLGIYSLNVLLAHYIAVNTSHRSYGYYKTRAYRPSLY